MFGGAVAENLRQAASDVQAAIIDGCGHYVSEERPDDLTRLLRRFFEEQAGLAAGGGDGVDAPVGAGQRLAGAAPAELDQLGGDRDGGLFRGPGA